MNGPLQGVRVVDLTINFAGPLSSQILGDMGADVIKVEPPHGDTNRSVGLSRNTRMGAHFLNLNRNKRSVVLDLKQTFAYDALMGLVTGADVFMHSMRPSAAKRLKIDYASISRINRRIVYSSISGYRSDGSKSERPAYDDALQGETGIVSLIKDATSKANFIPMPFVDKFIGHIQASAIGMALYRRERTGIGQEIRIPMFETMTAFNFIEHLCGSTFEPPLSGPGYPRMLSPNHRPFPTKDGYICLLAHTDAQWRNLLKLCGIPELINDPRFDGLGSRSGNLHTLYGLIGERFADRSTAEWQRLLDEHEIPNGPVNSLGDLLNSEYLRETGFFRIRNHSSEGIIREIPTQIEFSESGCGGGREAPRLGQHTREVLSEIGHSDIEITRIVGPQA